jgi:hypothetical protein
MELDRSLPAPLHSPLHGGEKVKLINNQQVYADGFVFKVGEQGIALHPGSQAATWIVYIPSVRTRRVVPEWNLEIVPSQNH